MNADISGLIAKRSDAAVDLLIRLISFRSTAGNEREVQLFLDQYIREIGFDSRLMPIHPDIEADEDYTLVPGHQTYDGRANIVFTVPGSGGGKSIILSTHTDVVPGPDELFEPKVEGDIVKGRGACDAKGHVVTVLLALQALRDAGVKLKGDVTTQFVIEEEAGGNGALSAVMDCPKADGALIIESTGFKVFPANRGAVWFELSIEGKTTHMGRWRDGVSAIDEMMDAIRILKDYEKKLVAESKGDPLFCDCEGCVKVNVGQIRGGDWPSMVPGHCTIEGGVGFLPNKRLADIRREVREAIEQNASQWTKEHYRLDFKRLHNEAYRMDPDHPLASTLYDAVAGQGIESEITGWTASCDARLYWHRGCMPTVVFGAGSVSYAHANNEQISIEEIKTGARILADFLVRWCGTQ